MAKASFSIDDLGHIIWGGTGEIVTYLQGKHLLASAKTCRCGATMNLGEKSDISDGLIFRCPACKTTKSIRDGSFFNMSRLTLMEWLILLYWWVSEYPVSDAAMEAKVGRDTAIDVYQWFREVCSTQLLGRPIRLGGPGKIRPNRRISVPP